MAAYQRCGRTVGQPYRNEGFTGTLGELRGRSRGARIIEGKAQLSARHKAPSLVAMTGLVRVMLGPAKDWYH